MSIFCDYCGKELPDGSVFCSQCGTKILHQSVRPTPEFQEDASEKRFDKAPYSASWAYKKAGRGILKIINTVTVSLSENMLTVYERWHSTLSERDAAQHTRELPRGEICRAEVRKRRLSPLYLLLLIVCTAAVFFIAGEVGANGPISAAVALAFAAVLALFYRFDLCHPELQLHLTSGKKVRLPAANVKDLAPVHTEIVKWAGLKSDADVIREKPKSRKKRVLIAVGIVAGAAAVIIGGVSCFEQFYLLRKLPETVLTSEAAVEQVREQMESDFGLDSLDADIRIEGGRLADTPGFPQKEGELYTFFFIDFIYDVAVTNKAGEKISGEIEADVATVTELFAQEAESISINQLEYSKELRNSLEAELQNQSGDEMAGRREVVAVCGDQELTNTELSIYFWQQYYNFMNTHGTDVSLFGIDTTQPLSDQMYDEANTWEDIFLQGALESFWQTAAVNQDAEKAGYALDQANSDYLDSLADGMAEEAEANGYKSLDAYVQSAYGPYVTIEDYLEFARQMMTASGYVSELYSGISYDEDDITAYFEDNLETYSEAGYSLDDPKMVNVRHILIEPVPGEDAETDESGTPVLTEQNWEDARVKAEEIYNMWLSGAATEDSFAELAGEYSSDPGSAATGGLYEEVYPGQMVQTFNDWCFDESRQPGDSGIVETDYGYHIMYFSGRCEHAYWYNVAEQDYLTNRQQAILDEIMRRMPMSVNYDNINISDSLIP